MPEQKVKDNHAVPAWLTADYLQLILRKYMEDEKLKVLSFVGQPATAAGENYASVITRITVVYENARSETHTGTYLIKISHADDDPAAEILIQYGIYTREMDIYESVLPQLTKILRETGDTKKLFADNVHVDREHSAIIFEDLSPLNFRTVNRLERLDMQHAKLALRNLARMHASAAVLNERSPGIFAKNFDRGFFNRHTQAIKSVMIGMMKALVRYVEKQPELKDKYQHKLVGLIDNLMEYGTRAFDACNENFMTLIHGDYWINNMMFRYAEDGTPSDVIPIDYQFSVWTSPAVDLHYFFNTSLSDELRLAHQPELVQYYYYVLVDTLRSINYRGHIPSLFKFNLEFEMRSFIAVFASFICQPAMIYNGKEICTFAGLAADDEAGIRMKDWLYENEIMQKNVHRLLPIFDEKGLLDPMD